LVFESTIPLVHYYTNQIPAADLASSSGISHALNFLQFIGLPSSILASLKGLLHDSSALMISIIFFFLPFNLSKIGAVIVTLLLPAYKSSLVIVETRATSSNKTSTKTREDKEAPQKTKTSMFTSALNWLQFTRSAQSPASQTPQQNRVQFWLEYWMCLATLLLLQSYGVIRLWPNSQMVLCLWLQNSHFSGAAMIFQRSSKLYRDLVSYEKTRASAPRALLAAAPPPPPASPSSDVSDPAALSPSTSDAPEVMTKEALEDSDLSATTEQDLLLEEKEQQETETEMEKEEISLPSSSAEVG
jgi:hypothetical protein